MHPEAPSGTRPITEEERRFLVFRDEGQRCLQERYGDTVKLGIADRSNFNRYLMTWFTARQKGEVTLPISMIVDNFMQSFHPEAQIAETPLSADELNQLLRIYTLEEISQVVDDAVTGNVRMESHSISQKLFVLRTLNEGLRDPEDQEFSKRALTDPVKRQRYINAILWIASYNRWSLRFMHNLLYSRSQRRGERTNSND